MDNLGKKIYDIIHTMPVWAERKIDVVYNESVDRIFFVKGKTEFSVDAVYILMNGVKGVVEFLAK